MAQSPLKWTEVNSSNVQALAYDPKTETLAVKFHNGGIYSYHDVEPGVLENVANAPSVGKAFNTMVKLRYSYLKWFDEADLERHLTTR